MPGVCVRQIAILRNRGARQRGKPRFDSAPNQSLVYLRKALAGPCQRRASTANIPWMREASKAAAGPFPDTSPKVRPNWHSGNTKKSKKSPPIARHGIESPPAS